MGAFVLSQGNQIELTSSTKTIESEANSDGFRPYLERSSNKPEGQNTKQSEHCGTKFAYARTTRVRKANFALCR
jgi:hypothetical protein